MTPRRIIIFGMLVTMASAALWDGPVGNGAARFTAETETIARLNLEYYELDDQVVAFMQRDPVTRRLWLAGKADDFQQRELKRILDGIPAVGDVQWWRPGGGTVKGDILLPLLLEVELAALAAFAFGLMLTYLVALRRRATAWSRF